MVLMPLNPADNNVQVLEVLWDNRIMPWNTTFATNSSKWLNINDINRFLPDFDPRRPAQLIVKMRGWINEPCPAQQTYQAPFVYCEYAFHGTDSQFLCCPLGFTGRGQQPDICGCRDDLDETPYRMAFVQEAGSPTTSTFHFSLASVTMQGSDFDGPDFDFGVMVSCIFHLDLFTHASSVL
jgi:hypothetical protein